MWQLIQCNRTNQKVWRLEERNTILSNDPEVRKFDAGRILCDICDRWLNVHPENHSEALQQWVSHRAACQKAFEGDQLPTQCVNLTHFRIVSSCLIYVHVNFSPPITVLPLSEQQLALASVPAISHATPSTSVLPSTPNARIANNGAPTSPPSPFKGDLNPDNFPTSQESRRRSAEQRAVTLRSDPLLADVEPNRVFCTLCQKWVQLRQDSSYCAYPWLQHRGKCVAKQ